MRRILYLTLVLALCTARARADISFNVLNSVANGTKPLLDAVKASEIARGNNAAGWPWSVKLADFDNDGKQDAYVTYHSSYGGYILKGNGDGSFVAYPAQPDNRTLPAVGTPYLLDFDGNGFKDICGFAKANLARTFKNVGGTFTQTPLCLAGGYGEYYGIPYWENIDANNTIDLRVLQKYAGTTKQYTRLNNGNFTVTLSTTNPAPQPPGLPASILAELAAKAADTSSANRSGGPIFWTGDLDGDGDSDVVLQYFVGYATSPTQQFGRYLIRNAEGVLEDKTAVFAIPGVPVLPPQDLNADGKLDLVTTHANGSGVFLQQPGGTFTNVSAAVTAFVRFAVAYEYVVKSVDLDQDGVPDLVVSNSRGKLFKVFRGTGADFVEVLTGNHWDGTPGFDLADVNGDGLVDIVIGGPGPAPWAVNSSQDTNITVYLNTSVPPPPPTPSVRRWSDPLSWPSGRVPTRADNVTIDRDILIDQAECKRLDVVAGTATLAEGGRLETYDGSVVVWADASFKATTGEILFHVSDDRAFVGNTTPGPRPSDPDDHSDTDYGLWGMEHSTIILDGPEVLSWTYAVPDTAVASVPVDKGVVSFPSIRAGTVTLGHDPVGWKVGDTILLAAVDGRTATATVSGISGKAVTFTGADSFSAGSLNRAGAWIHPKVANLSRRLVIASADVKEGDTNHRAHTICMHHGHVHFRDVEFRNLGPRGKLGRYPVHFHHVGHAGHGDGIENCSIWQSVSDPGSRFVSIHNSQGVTCTGNVGFRSRGHGFFMEDGREAGCSVLENLSVDVTGPEELTVKHSTVEAASHHFWLFPNNEIDSNTAVGGASGLVMIPTTPGDSCTVFRFEAMATGDYGMWSKCWKTTLDESSSVYAGSAGIACLSTPFYGQPVKGTDVINPILWLNGTRNTPTHPYRVGIIASESRDVTVTGGQIAGRNEAVHLHYPDAWVTLDNVDVESDYLTHPTYWEGMLRIIGGQRKVNQLFVGPYPPRKHSSGFVLDSNAYHVGSGFASLFPGAKTPLPFGSGEKLSDPLPPAGFIKAPPGGVFWTIRPAGSTATVKRLYRAETEARWRESLGTWRMGYPDGIAPGTYEVAFFTASEQTLTAGTVEVRSGEVVGLP